MRTPLRSSSSAVTRTALRAGGAISRGFALTLGSEQVDHEQQRRVWRNVRRRPFRAVAERRRDDEQTPSAHFHACDALVPAGDHLTPAKGEREGFVPLPRRVELFATAVQDA